MTETETTYTADEKEKKKMMNLKTPLEMPNKHILCLTYTEIVCKWNWFYLFISSR